MNHRIHVDRSVTIALSGLDPTTFGVQGNNIDHSGKAGTTSSATGFPLHGLESLVLNAHAPQPADASEYSRYSMRGSHVGET